MCATQLFNLMIADLGSSVRHLGEGFQPTVKFHVAGSAELQQILTRVVTRVAIDMMSLAGWTLFASLAQRR